MPLSTSTLDEIAKMLHTAARTATPVAQITSQHPSLTLDEAYTVQRALIRLRKESGESLVGMKMGLTSKAKMDQVGVHAPIYGHLTSGMVSLDGELMPRARFCHPRIEPEIAFVMGRELSGRVTVPEAMRAVDGVCCALELIDSRYENFKFALPDVVADNASSSAFVLGSTLRRPFDVDIGNLGMIMRVNGEVREVGSSSAILEHPARSLATLVSLLADRGETLAAGSVVMAGGATKAVALSPGDRVSLEVDGLGHVDSGLLPGEMPTGG